MHLCPSFLSCLYTRNDSLMSLCAHRRDLAFCPENSIERVETVLVKVTERHPDATPVCGTSFLLRLKMRKSVL